MRLLTMHPSNAGVFFALLAVSILDGASSLQKAAFMSSHCRPTSASTRFHSGRKSRQPSTSFAIPNVAALAEPSATQSVSQSASAFQALAATLSATLTYISLIAFFDRPRGELTIADPSSLTIQQSRVPNAGLGLFATKSLPAGTILGTYPGVIRPAETFYSGKCRMFPQAVGYSWRFTDSKYVIDPTDKEGNIQDYCLGGSFEVPLSNVIFSTLLSFWRVNTALCRINEPPIGAGGCNVSAKENLEQRVVVFELIQDVVSGQELYLDYGLDYDRSRYGPPPEGSSNAN